MELLERIKKAKEILNENWDFAQFGIFIEIDSYIVLKDEELEYLLDIALEVYRDYEYATPTGIGCAIVDILDERLRAQQGKKAFGTVDKDLNIKSITHEEIEEAWQNRIGT